MVWELVGEVIFGLQPALSAATSRLSFRLAVAVPRVSPGKPGKRQREPNEVVIFDEQGKTPAGVTLTVEQAASRFVVPLREK